MRTTPHLAVIVIILLAAGVADGAVLCAKRRADGKFSSTVKVREACRSNEVMLTPEAVGFCCTESTTSTTETTTTSIPCPTTTTLGAPPCMGTPTNLCSFVSCPGGQMCTDGGSGTCVCTGPFHCGGADHFCGGDCPAGQTCTQLPVPPGCGSIGCQCQ